MLVVLLILPILTNSCMQTAEPGTTIAPPTTSTIPVSTSTVMGTSSTSVSTSSSSSTLTSTVATTSSSTATSTSTVSSTTSTMTTTTKVPVGACGAIPPAIAKPDDPKPTGGEPIGKVPVVTQNGNTVTVTCTGPAGSVASIDFNDGLYVQDNDIFSNELVITLTCSANMMWVTKDAYGTDVPVTNIWCSYYA